MNSLVHEWIKKADGDFRTAEREMRVRGTPNYDAVCFHAQQCAEKYLKAFLTDHHVSFRPIHDLEVLLEAIGPIGSDFELIRDLLLLLNDYAVDIRYPGDEATRDEARAAVRAMRVVRIFVRGRLGLGDE